MVCIYICIYVCERERGCVELMARKCVCLCARVFVYVCACERERAREKGETPRYCRVCGFECVGVSKWECALFCV